MNGNVFQCFSLEQRDRRQYEKTIEALEGYVKKTLKYHEDIVDLFGPDMKNPEIEKPKELGDKTTDLDRTIQQEDEAKDYVKRTRILKVT